MASSPSLLQDFPNHTPESERGCHSVVGSYSKVLALFYQAVEGVVAMHGQGLVHRDIKLENIMVSCKENRCYAAVIDLGLACEEGAAIDTGGTPGYMAPEAWDVAGNGHAAGDFLFRCGSVPPAVQPTAALSLGQVRHPDEALQAKRR